MSEFDNLNNQYPNQPTGQYGQYPNQPAGQYGQYQNQPAGQNTQSREQPGGRYAQYRGQMYSGPKNPTVSKYEPNIALCNHMKDFISSNMGFAAAIMVAVAFLLEFVGMIISKEKSSYIGTEMVLLCQAIEAWVTFGSAKWNKWEIKTGGIVLGKVVSIIQIVCSGIGIVAGIALVFAGSYLVKALSTFSEEELYEIFESAGLDANFDINMLLSIGSGVIAAVVIFGLIIPLTLNIILNAKLNTFRNNLIRAIRRNLYGDIKTTGLAVIMFIYGVFSVLGSIIILIGAMVSEPGFVMFALSSLVISILYIYSGILVIKFGKYEKE